MVFTMKLRLPFVVLLCFFPLLLAAQQYMVAGYVTDDKTGDALIGVSIHPENQPSYGTTTDTGGHFCPFASMPFGKYFFKARSTPFFHVLIDSLFDSIPCTNFIT